MLNGGSVVVCSHGASLVALMYKMRERERDQGNVHKLMAFLCVSTMSEQEAVQYYPQRLPNTWLQDFFSTVFLGCFGKYYKENIINVPTSLKTMGIHYWTAFAEISCIFGPIV